MSTMSDTRATFVGMAVAAAACLGAPAAGDDGPTVHSKLWGKDGELWSAGSRLPDFSYAGYRRGEGTPPAATPRRTVRDFGARGDGRADDTEAFRRAIEDEKGRAVGVPAGRYVITGIVSITASGTVLKGEGPDRSVLVCPV